VEGQVVGADLLRIVRGVHRRQVLLHLGQLVLLTLAQVPSFWIQAIYGGIILVALMIARVTTGRAQD
jgi:ribose/xylose/arabinose/galactoside ABC-type transport system permease subunit